jgi:hypothetical protein
MMAEEVSTKVKKGQPDVQLGVDVFDVLIRGLDMAKRRFEERGESAELDMAKRRLEERGESAEPDTFCAFAYGEPGTYCQLLYYHRDE